MKLEYINYARLLEPLGDLMIEISNDIEVGKLSSLENAINRYDQAISAIEKVNPPTIIKTEHSMLTKSLRSWLEATKDGAELKSEESVQNSLVKQKQAEVDITKHIDQIVVKFNS